MLSWVLLALFFRLGRHGSDLLDHLGAAATVVFLGYDVGGSGRARCVHGRAGG
jgi:hypothetical protein